MKKIKLSLISMMILILIIAMPGFHNANAMGKISTGSGIAGISLEKKSIQEARTILEEEVEGWLSQEPLHASSDYETVTIPRHIFQFHIEDSLNELEELTKREWTNFFIKKKNVQIPLQVSLIPNYEEELNWSAAMNVEKTLDKALLIASHLLNSSVGIEYKESATFEEFEIATITMPLTGNSSSAISPIVEELDGKRIDVHGIYSFLEEIELPEGIANFDEAMSFVASGLYSLALQTELEIVERHQAESQPIFTEPGLEAMIHKEKKENLLLYNPSTNIFIIAGEVVEGNMVLKISSMGQETRVSYAIKNQRDIQPRRIYRYSPSLPPQTERVIADGVPGLQVEVYRQVRGEKLEEKRVSRDYYPPQHTIILTSSRSQVDEIDDWPETDPTSDLDGSEDLSDFNGSENNGNNGGTSSPDHSEFLSERVSEVLACEGDLACEEENEVTLIEKTLVTCLTTDSANDKESLCSTLYQYVFFKLLDNNQLNESDIRILNNETMLEDYLREKLILGETTEEDEVIKGNEE